MANEQDIIVRIKAEGTGEFIKGLKRAEGAVEDVGDEVEKTEKKMSSSFKKIGSVIGAAFATQQLIQFARHLTKLAVELDATEKKFTTVFGTAGKVVEDFAKTNARALGLTTSEYKKAAAAAGDLLIPLGFQRKEAAELSSQLVNLSGALSAWTGGQLDAKQVSDVLTKALLGEREQLKQLGIQISEADVKQKLLEKGQQSLTGSTLAQAKATATLELILGKSKDAQVAFADDTKTLAEQQLELSAGVRQLSENLAQSLVPALNDLIGFLNDALTAYNRFADRISGRKALSEFEESIEQLDEYALKVERLGLTLRRNQLESENVIGSSKFIFEIDKQIEAIDRLLASRKQETESLEENTEDIKKADAELKKFTVSWGQFFQEFDTGLSSSNAELSKFIETVKDGIVEIQSITEGGLIGNAQEDIDDFTNSADIITDGIDDIRKRQKLAAQEAEEQRQQRINSSISAIQQAFDVFVALNNAEQQILENRFAQGLISEKEYQEQRAELQTKQAKANKANSIFEIGLNTASAITSALKAGPIIGPILAAVIGGLAAAQLAAVLKTPIPKFAKGTRQVGDGYELGEDRTLAWLNSGERVVTAKDNKKHYGLYNAIEDGDVNAMIKEMASMGVAVQFNAGKLLADELDRPMKTLKQIKGDAKSGIDWNPLLNASERSRRSLRGELMRVNHNLEQMRRDGRKMTRA